MSIGKDRTRIMVTVSEADLRWLDEDCGRTNRSRSNLVVTLLKQYRAKVDRELPPTERQQRANGAYLASLAEKAKAEREGR